MFFLLIQGVELLSTGVVLLPFFVFLHICYFRKAFHSLCCYALALYWGTIYALTGLPTIQFFIFDPYFYLIPFAGFFNDLANSILNILLFVPIGLLLPMLCNSCCRFKNIMIIGFLCSLTIELGQIFTYRVTDINDLITNAAGTALGYFLFNHISLTIKTQLSVKDLFITAAVSVLTMFFFQQALSSYVFCLIF